MTVERFPVQCCIAGGGPAGMMAGLGICMYYMVRTYPFFGCTPAECVANQWFGLNAISAGMIGLPVGLVTIIVVSLITAPPDKKVQEMVDHVRYPHLRGDTVSTLGT